MRKVLLVSYHFPPNTAMGAARPAQFAKYLPECGWEPVVLTVAERYYERSDDVSASPRPGRLLVVRTPMLRSPHDHYLRLRRLLSPAGGHPPATGSGQPPASSPWWRRSLGSLLAFPDEQVGWFPFAVAAGLRLVRRHGIRVAVTSGPPHSVHLIGAALRRLARVTWIADFRDPCLDSYVERVDPTLANRLAVRLGAWYTARADQVLTATDRLAARLRAKYPRHASKVITLTNGYDPDEFATIPPQKAERFTISHVGTLHVYGRRDPKPLLRAAAELIQEGAVDPANFRLRFVGVHPEAGRSLSPAIARYGLTPNVDLVSWVSRHTALEIMVQSHALLVLADQQPLEIPGKVFEYLAAGSDILALTEDGATADLLGETGRGLVVAPDDPAALKAALLTLYRRHGTRPNGGLGRRVPPPKYSRRNLTRELAHLLDRVVTRPLDASPEAVAAPR